MKPLVSKNLKSLLGEVNSKSLRKIRVDLIDPDPDQPRKNYTQEQIEERGRSLQTQGQLQPIEVTEKEDGRFLLVFGELRWRGAGFIQWEELDAVVNTSALDAGERLTRQLVENLQRDDMPAMDTANAVQKLVELKGSAAEAGRAIGKSEGQISKYLAVLKLPPAAAELAASGVTRDVETLATVGKIEREAPERARQIVDEAKKSGKVTRESVREVAQEVAAKAAQPKKAVSKKRQQEIDLRIADLNRLASKKITELEKLIEEWKGVGEHSENGDGHLVAIRTRLKKLAK